jgi:bacterioferritin (cytochrome b1)
MPLETHVKPHSLRAGLQVCRKKLAATTKRLLQQKLEDLEHQAQDIAHQRARIEGLLKSFHSDNDETT